MSRSNPAIQRSFWHTWLEYLKGFSKNEPDRTQKGIKVGFKTPYPFIALWYLSFFFTFLFLMIVVFGSQKLTLLFGFSLMTVSYILGTFLAAIVTILLGKGVRLE